MRRAKRYGAGLQQFGVDGGKVAQQQAAKAVGNKMRGQNAVALDMLGKGDGVAFQAAFGGGVAEIVWDKAMRGETFAQRFHRKGVHVQAVQQ